MTLLGFTGTIQKLRAGAIDFQAATLTAISGALFAPLGAWLNKQLRPVVLLVLFALAVLTIGIRMLLQREADAKRLRQSRHALRARGVTVVGSGAAGAVIGLLGGLLGISGGFIAVPVLVTYQGLEMHRAVATSWVIITLVSASATAGHFLAGQRVSLGDALLFLIGGVIGFEVAVRVAHRFSERGLRQLFGVAIFMMSIVMLVRLVAG
jgi:uncharacterized membrane protein YfcA